MEAIPKAKEEGFDEPTFVTAAADYVATQFKQAVTEIPTESVVTMNKPELSPTDQSWEVDIDGKAAIATFWTNVNLDNPFLYSLVNAWKLREIVDSYDATSYREWWYQYRAAIPAYKATLQTERQNGNFDDYLRDNAHMFIKRFVGRLFQYEQIKKYQTAAYAQLCLFSRLLQGRKVARWAKECAQKYINNVEPSYIKFPFLNDDEAYITHNTRFAVGKDTYGRDIVAFGLWKIDPSGSIGAVADPFAYVDTSDKLEDLFEWNSETHAVKLDTLSGNDAAAKHNAECQRATLMWMARHGVASPFVENGPSIGFTAVKDGSPISGTARLYDETVDQVTFNDVEFKMTVKGNVVARYWKAFAYWTEMLEQHFQDFSDPNSDAIRIAKLIRGVKPASTSVDFLNAVRSNKSWDITDLANKLKWQGEMHADVNTQTVVAYVPPIFNPDDEEAYWRYNFDRYDVFNDSLVDAIESANYFPTFTPTIFASTSDSNDVAKMPIVLNSTPSFGWEDFRWDAVHKVNGRVTSATGRYSSILDIIANSRRFNKDNNIDMIGVTQGFGTKYAEAGQAFVFTESPTNIFLAQMPLFNTSDPLQCGFNIVVTGPLDSPWENDWTAWLKGELADKTSGLGNPPSDFLVSRYDGYPLAPSYESQPETADRANVINDGYLGHMVDTLVFVGGSIFMHPVFSVHNITSGYLMAKYKPAEVVDGQHTWESNVWKLLFDKEYDPTLTSYPQTMRYLSLDRFAHARGTEVSPNHGDVKPLIRELATDCPIIIRYYEISPDYGPFTPIMDEVPAIVSGLYLNYYGSEAPLSVLEHVDGHGDMRYRTPPIEFTQGGDKGVSTGLEFGWANPIMHINPEFTPAKSANWFIEKVAYMPVGTRNGRNIPSGKTPLIIRFAGINEYVLRQMAQPAISWRGGGKVISVAKHEVPSTEDVAPSIAETGYMPVMQVFSPPRINRAASKYTVTKQTGGKFGDSSNSHGNSKQKHPKGQSKVNGNNDKKSNDNNDSNRKSSFESETQVKLGDGFSGVSTQGQAFDSTTPNVDADVKKKLKGSPSAKEVEQGLQ